MALPLSLAFLLLLLSLSGLLPPCSQAALTCDPLTWHRPDGVPDYFFPFGEGLDDVLALPQDDGSRGPLPIDPGFVFYYQRFTNIYVNVDGVLSFLAPVPGFSPSPFPLDGLNVTVNATLTEEESNGFLRGFVMIAPYWANVELRPNAIYYRQTTNESVLCHASSFVRQRHSSYSQFQASWVYVATWHNVTFAGNGVGNGSRENTFQAVLVTDETLSFVIFNYGSITWTSAVPDGGDASGLGGVGAEIGFNAGDGINFFRLPQSRTDAVLNLNTALGNTMLPGQWLFRVDGENVLGENCATLQTQETIFLSPVFGFPYGGKLVNIAGPCFAENAAVVCRIRENSAPPVETPGEVISPQVATCLTPALNDTGRYTLELSIDGGGVFNYSGLYIARETDSQYLVSRVNEELWLNGSFEDLLFTWDHTILSDDYLRVDFVDFRDGIAGRVITLLPNISNNGSAMMPLGLPYAALEDLTDDLPFFGAIRLSGATPGAPPHYLWSDPNAAFWFTTRYFQEIYARTADGQTLPPGGQELFDFLDEELNLTASSGTTRRRKRDAPQLHGLAVSIRIVMLVGRFVGDILCSRFVRREMANPTDFSDLPIPPCTVRQARKDPNFELDEACDGTLLKRPVCAFFHPGAERCYRSRVAVNGKGQQACYDDNGNLITDGLKGGGTVDKFLPGAGPHFSEDVLPFLYCCKTTDRCRDYLRFRPVHDCEGYRCPNNGWMGGDPHFITMDGRLYTFNGIGEYFLLDTPTFNVQVRTNKFMDTASAVTAVVAERDGLDRVQVEINPTLDGIQVRVNGDVKDAMELQVYQGPDAPVEIEADSDTVTVSFFEPSAAGDCTGETLLVRRFQDVLSATLRLPPCYEGQTAGLVGNFDLNSTNDFIPRGSTTPLPDDSDPETIHDSFGETWRVPSVMDSLFEYLIGQSYESTQDPAFRPAFLTLQDLLTPETQALCGTDPACLFDFNITGSAAFAGNTLQEVEREMEENALFMQAQEPCFSRPCGERGECENTGSTFTCICNDTFTGVRCETAVTACTINPCQNDGLCRLSPTDPRGYECGCRAGFSGEDCETAVNDNPCESSPCLNTATCFVLSDEIICSCAPGFTGDRCETAVTACFINPCQNGGLCRLSTTDPRGYECSCQAGFSGEDCETDIPGGSCLEVEDPCQNGGTCFIDQNGEARCLCPPGYAGVRCHVESEALRLALIFTLLGVLFFIIITVPIICYWCYRQRLLQRFGQLRNPQFPIRMPRAIVPFNPRLRNPTFTPSF